MGTYEIDVKRKWRSWRSWRKHSWASDYPYL